MTNEEKLNNLMLNLSGGLLPENVTTEEYNLLVEYYGKKLV